jgi:hypothetical protein
MKSVKVTKGFDKVQVGTILILPDRHANILLRHNQAVLLVDCVGCSECVVEIVPPMPEPFIHEIPESFYAPKLECAEEVLSPAVETDINEEDMEEEEVEFDDTTPQS